MSMCLIYQVLNKHPQETTSWSLGLAGLVVGHSSQGVWCFGFVLWPASCLQDVVLPPALCTCHLQNCNTSLQGINKIIRTENGYTCASFDRDINPRSMDFLGAPGFVFLCVASIRETGLCIKTQIFTYRMIGFAQANRMDCHQHARQLHQHNGPWLQLLGIAG